VGDEVRNEWTAGGGMSARYVEDVAASEEVGDGSPTLTVFSFFSFPGEGIEFECGRESESGESGRGKRVRAGRKRCEIERARADQRHQPSEHEQICLYDDGGLAGLWIDYVLSFEQ
jgi:hypothetical protein